jgi:hypothetical protein
MNKIKRKSKTENWRISPILLSTLLIISFISISNVVTLIDLFQSSALSFKLITTEPKVTEVKQQQEQHKVIEASGHFANNQIENGSVTWIQGGLWHLVVLSNNSSPTDPISENTSASIGPSEAAFSANFTMVKPDGSESHEHSINNFISNNVIIAGGDMVITGIGDIISDGVLKFKQVPITVHLMGKEHVLGLIIDTVKTKNHFASTHEMFGTLIAGTGLDQIEKTLPTVKEQLTGKGMNMNMNMG